MSIPASVKSEVDAFRKEMPGLSDWDDKRIYRALKVIIQISFGVRLIMRYHKEKK